MKTSTTEEKPIIHLTTEDYHGLRSLAAATPKSARPNGTPTLLHELERATVVARELLPPGVVTVNSRVRFQDVDSGEVNEFIVTWPDRTDGGVERISVLAPIGTALIGFKKGDEVSWPTPGGTRRLRILEVHPAKVEARSDEEKNYFARLMSRPA